MRKLICILAVLAFAATAAAAAVADSPRITRGDAQAIFEARFTGDVAIVTHSPTLEGAPAQDALGRILPFAVFNGRHYCSLDWHSLSLFFYDFGDRAFVAGELAPYVYDWTLDGAPLATETTAVTRVDPDWLFATWGTSEGYGAGNGAILPPEALAPGMHTAHLVVTDSSNGSIVFDNGLTFIVDPPDAKTCS